MPTSASPHGAGREPYEEYEDDRFALLVKNAEKLTIALKNRTLTVTENVCMVATHTVNSIVEATQRESDVDVLVADVADCCDITDNLASQFVDYLYGNGGRPGALVDKLLEEKRSKSTLEPSLPPSPKLENDKTMAVLDGDADRVLAALDALGDACAVDATHACL